MTNEELSISDATLIARLRDEHVAASRTEAAARIEALIAERDEALEWLSASQGYIADAVYALDKQEAAEAKLAKAVEALENIAHGGAYTDMQIARATLAEIKGESHE